MLHRSRYLRTPIAAAAVSLSLALGLSAGTVPATAAPSGQDECTVSIKLVPTCGAFFGVAANPYGSESFDQAMVNFENRIGRTVDIAHYYTRGQATVFPTATMRMRADEPGRERLLFVNWKPVGLTWRAVANGAADSYLRSLAQHIRTNFDRPFFLSIEAEPEDNVNATAGSGMTAIDFRDFFRHTVQVLRANGATKVVTVMNYMGAPHWPNYSWFYQLYPGGDVVDWIAEDAYSFGSKPGVFLTDFKGTVDRHYPGGSWPGFYTWATRTFPDKPIMLGEWGAAEKVEYPWFKPDYFNNTLSQFAGFPALKALVYWDTKPGLMVGDTRPHSTTATYNAYRPMARSRTLTESGEIYLGRPALR